ncbi:hypothetical protein GH714_033084 [Hevea brasiliensis]|uniref:Protein kinase domain-containing protein n=1 Tax=Hevea brasiliensis TaxID=3981 RepID=A0A6A6N5U6_HEVBR|nr:hypothetical protein GH714_033084 [Hevea brasiliensis]
METLLKASAYILGSSKASIVYKAVLADGTAFAVRRIGESGVESFRDFENQVRFTAKFRHPNLVKSAFKSRIKPMDYWFNDRGQNQVLKLADVVIMADVVAKEDAMVACLKLGFSCACFAPEKRPSMKEALQVLEKIT